MNCEFEVCPFKELMDDISNLHLQDSSIDNMDTVVSLASKMVEILVDIEKSDQRTKQAIGIQQARKEGKRLGRPRLERPSQATWDIIMSRISSGVSTVSDEAELLNVSKTTFRKWMMEDELEGLKIKLERIDEHPESYGDVNEYKLRIMDRILDLERMLG